MTLAGAAIAGAISVILSHQQMKYTRAQLVDDDERRRSRRSVDRRFDAYADFFAQARAYRDATRHLPLTSGNELQLLRLDGFASSADTASSLVFIVLESQTTYRACWSVVAGIGTFQARVHDAVAPITEDKALAMIAEMARLLRRFQVAVRDELKVGV